MGRAGSLQRQLPSRTLSLPFKRSGSKLCLRCARQSLRTGVLKARAVQTPHGCPVNSYKDNSRERRMKKSFLTFGGNFRILIRLFQRFRGIPGAGMIPVE